jgi:hypothetical protein
MIHEVVMNAMAKTLSCSLFIGRLRTIGVAHIHDCGNVTAYMLYGFPHCALFQITFVTVSGVMDM